MLLPSLTELRSALAHLVDLALDGLDADANAPPVGFQLGFTGSAGADAATEP